MLYSILIGLMLGTGGFYINKCFVDRVTSARKTSYAGLLTALIIGKYILILGAFIVIALTWGVAALIGCAGGIFVSSLGFSIVRSIRKMRT